MLNLSPHLRIFLHTQPTDMRKSFDGLSALVRSAFGADPLDGSLFLFVNRRRDRIKMLYWDRDGLAIWYKRLEAGTFEAIPADDDARAVEIDGAQLAMLLAGVCLGSAKRRKRYARAGLGRKSAVHEGSE
jgi:transposase